MSAAPALVTIEPEEYDRRHFAGGSDAAGILNLQPSGWRTAVEIWQHKTDTAEPTPDTDKAKRKVLARGQIVEPLVARMLELIHGISATVKQRRYIDAEFPYMAAEIDAEIPFAAVAHLFPGIDAPADEIVNVEIKTVHPFAVKEWGEELTDEVPIHYAAQIFHGLGVTRRRLAICAALFGADDLVLYPLVGDTETIAGVRAKIRAFWENHVWTGIPPAPQTIKDTTLLWPKDDRSALQCSDTMRAHLRTLVSLKQAEKTYDAGADGVTLLIREGMKTAAVLVDGDTELATLKNQPTTSIDADKLKTEYPDAYAATVRRGTTRVLRVKENAL